MSNKNKKIWLFRISEWILSLFFWDYNLKLILEDLEEGFNEIRTRKGLLRAYNWLLVQLMKIISGKLYNTLTWEIPMLFNYLKIALRNIRKHKVYSFINISGLAIGIAGSILVLMYVQNELSYDKFHANADNTYIVNGKTKSWTYSRITPVLGKTLSDDYTDVKNVTRLTIPWKYIVKYKNTAFKETKILGAESSFFNVFSFPLTKGDPETALSLPNTAVITESIAKKYFGSEDPYGKVIEINRGRGESLFTITGIISDPPRNSHIDYNILISSLSIPFFKNDEWLNQVVFTYVVLNEKVQKAKFELTLDSFAEKHIRPLRKNDYTYVLQPLTDIYLQPHGDNSANREIFLYIFSLIGIFILLIACINFINLTTAKSIHRSKEIGVRKVSGAARSQLIVQFLSESVIVSIAAGFFSIVLIYLQLPLFNDISGKQLSVEQFDTVLLFGFIVILSIFTGIISGLYPAFFISKLNPISAVKGNIYSESKKPSSYVRKGLIIFQYSITVFFVICSFIIFEQLEHFKTKDLGFNKENMLVIHNSQLLEGQENTFKEQIEQYSGVSMVSETPYLLTKGFPARSRVYNEGQEKKFIFDFFAGDHDFLETYEFELISGRYFSKSIASDINSVIINEKAAKELGFPDPVGRKIKIHFRNADLFEIIGVVKNFHYEPLQNEMKNIGLILNDERFSSHSNYITVRTNNLNSEVLLENIENSWNSFSPKLPFEYSYFTEDYDDLYKVEQNIGRIANVSSMLAIFISCLGLFGLISYIVEIRRKELGIRKVLGASITGLVSILSREIITLFLMANLVSWPIAWYIMGKWLNQFAYKINPDINIFLMAGLTALAITALTIGFQTIKAALNNPVDVLRNE